MIALINFLQVLIYLIMFFLHRHKFLLPCLRLVVWLKFKFLSFFFDSSFFPFKLDYFWNPLFLFCFTLLNLFLKCVLLFLFLLNWLVRIVSTASCFLETLVLRICVLNSTNNISYLFCFLFWLFKIWLFHLLTLLFIRYRLFVVVRWPLRFNFLLFWYNSS